MKENKRRPVQLMSPSDTGQQIKSAGSYINVDAFNNQELHKKIHHKP